jgi:hypothetical protein
MWNWYESLLVTGSDRFPPVVLKKGGEKPRTELEDDCAEQAHDQEAEGAEGEPGAEAGQFPQRQGRRAGREGPFPQAVVRCQRGALAGIFCGSPPGEPPLTLGVLSFG